MRGCTTHISDVRNRVVKSRKFLHFAINTLIYFLKQKEYCYTMPKEINRYQKCEAIHHSSYVIYNLSRCISCHKAIVVIPGMTIVLMISYTQTDTYASVGK